MISKLTNNLLAGFDGFTIAWKSTFNEDCTLANLKPCLCKEEKKILWHKQKEIALDTEAFYTNCERLSISTSHKSQSTNRSLHACGFSIGTFSYGYINP